MLAWPGAEIGDDGLARGGAASCTGAQLAAPAEPDAAGAGARRRVRGEQHRRRRARSSWGWSTRSSRRGGRGGGSRARFSARTERPRPGRRPGRASAGPAGARASWRTVGATSTSAASSQRPGRDAGARHHPQPVPRVVGVVGAGVVLERVVAPVAERAVAAPREVAEVDDEVGRDAAALAPEVLGAVDARADRAVRARRAPRAARSARRAAPRSSAGAHDALRLAALDVEEQPAVVAALAPRPRARPVDVGVAQRRAGRRRRVAGTR